MSINAVLLASLLLLSSGIIASSPQKINSDIWNDQGGPSLSGVLTIEEVATTTIYGLMIPPPGDLVGSYLWCGDINGDDVINDLDRTYIGDPHPDFQVGFNVDLAYRGFDLTAFFFWNQGGDIFNYARYRTDFNTFQYNRSDRMLYDSWTPQNTDALLPVLDLNDTYSNTYVTSYFVEDATYLRLRQLQLGYSVPASLISKIRVDRLRLYVSAQNLFTITNYSGLDPGISIQGSDLSMGVSSGERPTPKQILFGINLGF